MKQRQFAAASSSPIGVPAMRTWMSSATPATVRASANALRRVRAPYAARAMMPRNSMPATVASGSRSRAR